MAEEEKRNRYRLDEEPSAATSSCEEAPERAMRAGDAHESEVKQIMSNETQYNGGTFTGAASDAEIARIRRDAEVGETAPEVTPVETNLSGGEQNNGPVRG